MVNCIRLKVKYYTILAVLESINIINRSLPSFFATGVLAFHEMKVLAGILVPEGRKYALPTCWCSHLLETFRNVGVFLRFWCWISQKNSFIIVCMSSLSQLVLPVLMTSWFQNFTQRIVIWWRLLFYQKVFISVLVDGRVLNKVKLCEKKILRENKKNSVTIKVSSQQRNQHYDGDSWHQRSLHQPKALIQFIYVVIISQRLSQAPL